MAIQPGVSIKSNALKKAMGGISPNPKAATVVKQLKSFSSNLISCFLGISARFIWQSWWWNFANIRIVCRRCRSDTGFWWRIRFALYGSLLLWVHRWWFTWGFFWQVFCWQGGLSPICKEWGLRRWRRRRGGWLKAETVGAAPRGVPPVAQIRGVGYLNNPLCLS